MPTVNTSSHEVEATAPAVEALRLELARCQRKTDECQKRMEQMKSLFVHVAYAIFVAEPDGRIVDVNPAACELRRSHF